MADGCRPGSWSWFHLQPQIREFMDVCAECQNPHTLFAIGGITLTVARIFAPVLQLRGGWCGDRRSRKPMSCGTGSADHTQRAPPPYCGLVGARLISPFSESTFKVRPAHLPLRQKKSPNMVRRGIWSEGLWLSAGSFDGTAAQDFIRECNCGAFGSAC